MLLLPFFASGDGIVWIGNQPDPWIQLEVNFVCLLAIIAWAGAHSLIIFGGLSYFDLLNTEREFLGMLRHDVKEYGKSAYLATALKEAQYGATSNTGKSLPSCTSGKENNEIRGSLEPIGDNSNRLANGGRVNIAMEKIE